MRKAIAALFAGIAAVCWLLAEIAWPSDQRGTQVIIPPSAEDCARFVRDRQR